MKQRRLPDGWASWFLILAAAVPAAATTRLAWTILSGSVDDAYGSQDPPATGRDLLGIRWSNLWINSSIPTMLLTGLVVLIVLAALVTAGRPRALTPIGTARTLATLVAAFTALLGLIGVAGFAAQLTGLLPINMWSGPTGSKLDAFAPDVAAVLATTVVAIAATAALAHHDPDPDPDIDIDIADGEALDEETSAEAAAVDAAVDVRVAAEVVAPQAAAHEPCRPQAPSPRSFPTASASDLEHYRRR